MSIRTRMEAARDLIKAKRYDEARALLATIDHPKAKEWLAKLPESKRPTPSKVTVTKGGNKYLYQASPSMWRNSPFLFAFLAVSVIGWPFLLYWWLSVKNAELTVTYMYIVLKHGILSKHINEIHVADVRNVKISQGLFQRLMGTGVIEISTASASTDDILVSGLPNPYKIKEIINQERQ